MLVSTNNSKRFQPAVILVNDGNHIELTGACAERCPGRRPCTVWSRLRRVHGCLVILDRECFETAVRILGQPNLMNLVVLGEEPFPQGPPRSFSRLVTGAQVNRHPGGRLISRGHPILDSPGCRQLRPADVRSITITLQDVTSSAEH